MTWLLLAAYLLLTGVLGYWLNRHMLRERARFARNEALAYREHTRRMRALRAEVRRIRND